MILWAEDNIMSFSLAFFHFFWFLPSSSLSSPQSAGWYADAPRHDSGFPPLPLPGWLLPGWCVPPTLLHHPSVELPASPASLLLRPAKMVAGGDCRCRTDGCTQVGWLEMEEDEERDQWISSDGWYWTDSHRCGAAGRGSWSPVEERERENGRRGEHGWS